jgi:DNA-binding winged helix-turn-helix (wHTH) protein/TolB-like protein/Flp pilus assembly protein TadD
MTPKSQCDYLFSGFRVDIAGRRLLDSRGNRVDIPPRAFDVLLYLIEQRGEDVSKDRLLAAAWPGMVVEDNNLNQAITALRRAFADQRNEPRFIMTLPGRGYRFVAPVSEAGPAPVPAPATTQPAGQSRRYLAWFLAAVVVAAGFILFSHRNPAPPAEVAIDSLAVIPFRPLLREQSNPPLELGMVDALIGQIGALPGITVRPLSTVAGFTDPNQDPLEIGRKLGVAAVLEGTLQKEGDRLRVSARLLRVSDGRSLWSGSFDERMTGIFEVQDGIADLVMQTLAGKLGAPAARPGARPTLNLEAYQLYVSGLFNLMRRDIDGSGAAIEDFRAAIRQDPSYALAWARISNVRSMQSAFGILPAAAALPEARIAAQRAIELDSELALAQASMGQVLVQFDRNFAAGEQYYARARRLDPNAGIIHLWSSINYLCLGRVDDALAAARRAQEVEPGNLSFTANVGRVLYYARRYEDAAAIERRLLQLVPTFDDAHSILARALLKQGKVAEALEQFTARTKPSPGSFGDLGRAYAIAGRKADAHAQVSALRERAQAGFGMAYDIASIHALLGEVAPACTALRQALSDHSQLIGMLRLDPDFDALRGESCVQDVERELYAQR